jgi:hypothetical protein
MSAAFAVQSTEGIRLLLSADEGYNVPFEEGERVRYEVHWQPLFLTPAFKAGEVSISINESKYGETETFRIIGRALSSGALSEVTGFKIENYYESEIDRSDFRSYQYLQKTRQGNRRRNMVIRFDYVGNRTSVRITDPSVDPPRELRNNSYPGIPAPAVDVLSVFYVARLHSVSPGDRFLIHLNQSGRFQKVQVVAEKAEIVETPLGKFPCVKITTTGGLFREGGDFRIWYSRDKLRIPTKFEGDLKFGKVYGQLVGLETPQMTKTLIRLE